MLNGIKHTIVKFIFLTSVPSKAICHEIGSALWKIGSTDFVKMNEKDTFSYYFRKFSV